MSQNRRDGPRQAPALPRDPPDLATVFDLLGDETRLRIVHALAARRAADADPALPFSELRSRVGARDAGRFNYHLGELRGRLVKKSGDGYVLTDDGVRVGRLLLDAVPAADPA